jgi:hypothetical protein
LNIYTVYLININLILRRGRDPWGKKAPDPGSGSATLLVVMIMMERKGDSTGFN